MSWYSLRRLDSGLPILAAPTHSPSATAIFMVKAGSKNEFPAQAGVSHFLEHFVFRGTAKFKTGRQVVRALDRLGADHNASTSKEATAYWVRAAAGHLPQALEFLSEIILNPSLPEKLLVQEKGTILQEMAMIEDHPMAKIGEDFEKLFFGADTPLGRPIIGAKHTVAGLTRDDLVAYRQKFYLPRRPAGRPGNIVLAVAGGVKPEEVFRLAQAAFGQWPKAADYKGYKDYKIYKSYKRPRAARRLIQARPLDQVHLILGVPAFPALDPRRYALGILLTILGGNTSSQLFQEIRENRGLAYYIRAGSTRYREAGYAAVSAGFPPKKAKTAVDLIKKMLSGFKMSPQEFSEAKSYNQGQLALDWEESSHIAAHLASDYLFEQPVISSRLSVVGSLPAGRQGKSTGFQSVGSKPINRKQMNSKLKTDNRKPITDHPHIRSFRFLSAAVDKVAPDQVASLAKELFANLDKKLYLAAIGPVDDNLMTLSKSVK